MNEHTQPQDTTPSSAIVLLTALQIASQQRRLAAIGVHRAASSGHLRGKQYTEQGHAAKVRKAHKQTKTTIKNQRRIARKSVRAHQKAIRAHARGRRIHR